MASSTLCFTTPCGHTAFVKPITGSVVSAAGGGRWICRITGPTVRDAGGIKTLYCPPSEGAATSIIAKALRVPVLSLEKKQSVTGPASSHERGGRSYATSTSHGEASAAPPQLRRPPTVKASRKKRKAYSSSSPDASRSRLDAKLRSIDAAAEGRSKRQKQTQQRKAKPPAAQANKKTAFSTSGSNSAASTLIQQRKVPRPVVPQTTAAVDPDAERAARMDAEMLMLHAERANFYAARLMREAEQRKHNSHWRQSGADTATVSGGTDSSRQASEPFHSTAATGGGGPAAIASNQRGRSATPMDKYEYSPNSMARCRKCRKKISKGEIRVGVQHFNEDMDRWEFKYYHRKCCSAKALRNLNLPSSSLQGGSPDQSSSSSPAAVSQALEEELRRQSRELANNARVVYTERAPLREALRSLRREFAARLGRAPCCVFTDATLDDIVLRVPTTKAGLMACHGIGPSRYKNFGKSILKVVGVYSRSLKRQEQMSQQDGRTDIVRKSDRGATEVEEDLDEVVTMEDTLTMEQIVDQKFKDAERNGEMISLDDDDLEVDEENEQQMTVVKTERLNGDGLEESSLGVIEID